MCMVETIVECNKLIFILQYALLLGFAGYAGKPVTGCTPAVLLCFEYTCLLSP